MHIVIGVLTAVAGLFWAITALQNSGAIDALNPFLWYRRHQWRKKYSEKPIYSLSQPIEVAGLLIVGLAKAEGELSKELKQAILAVFENEFHLNKENAQQLFVSSAFLIKDYTISPNDIGKIFARSKDKFGEDKVESLLSIMSRISRVDCELNHRQIALIDATRNYFQSMQKGASW